MSVSLRVNCPKHFVLSVPSSSSMMGGHHRFVLPWRSSSISSTSVNADGAGPGTFRETRYYEILSRHVMSAIVTEKRRSDQCRYSFRNHVIDNGRLAIVQRVWVVSFAELSKKLVKCA